MNAQQLQFLVIILSAILGIVLLIGFALYRHVSTSYTILNGIVEESQTRLKQHRQELEATKASHSQYLHLSQSQALALQAKIHDQETDLANLQTNQELHLRLLEEGSKEIVQLRNHIELVQDRDKEMETKAISWEATAKATDKILQETAKELDGVKAQLHDMTANYKEAFDHTSQTTKELEGVQATLKELQTSYKTVYDRAVKLDEEKNSLETKLLNAEKLATSEGHLVSELRAELDIARGITVPLTPEQQLEFSTPAPTGKMDPIKDWIKDTDGDIPTEQIIKDINEADKADKPSPKKFQLLGLFRRGN